MAEQTLESIRNEMRIFLDVFEEFDNIATKDFDAQDYIEYPRKERIALFGIYIQSIKKR